MKREVSLGVGLATAALVWGVFNSALPSMAESRVSAPHDDDLASTERAATWTAAAVVAGVSLISQDMTVFVLGGSMVIGLAWWHRHANHYDSVLGRVTPMSKPAGPTYNGLSDNAGYMPPVG